MRNTWILNDSPIQGKIHLGSCALPLRQPRKRCKRAFCFASYSSHHCNKTTVRKQMHGSHPALSLSLSLPLHILSTCWYRQFVYLHLCLGPLNPASLVRMGWSGSQISQMPTKLSSTIFQLLDWLHLRKFRQLTLPIRKCIETYWNNICLSIRTQESELAAQEQTSACASHEFVPFQNVLLGSDLELSRRLRHQA